MKNTRSKAGSQDGLVRRCPACHQPGPDKGRGMDGRRAYRCKSCGNVWTEGMQGRKRTYSPQRTGCQFKDTQKVFELSRSDNSQISDRSGGGQ